jgi:hypothetical protein
VWNQPDSLVPDYTYHDEYISSRTRTNLGYSIYIDFSIVFFISAQIESHQNELTPQITPLTRVTPWLLAAEFVSSAVGSSCGSRR